jgi:hypothetical protein
MRPSTSNEEEDNRRRGVPLLPRGSMTANNAGNSTPLPPGTPPPATAAPAANNGIYSSANTNPALNNPAPPPPGAPRPPGTPPPASGPAPGGAPAPDGAPAASPSPTGSDQPGGAHNAANQPFNPSQVLSAVTGAASPLLGSAFSLPTSLLGMGMGLLAPFSQILQQFGQGEPAMPSTNGMPTDVLNSLGSLDPSSGVTGDLGDKYASDVNDQANQAQALDHLDKDLRKTLEASAANSKGGRDKIQQIIAQVNSSLQSLGSVSNTPLGQAGVLQAITQGLQQAGAVLSQAVGNDALNANSVKAMAGDYAQDMTGKNGQDAQLVGAIGPGGPLTANSSPEQVFAAVLAEAKRRGYSLEKALACASTMLQESGGRPTAQSPNGLWYGPFQQDAGYAGRHNPNLAIHEFFDRLDAKGGRTSPDIWKSIFWLQQAPGMSSAEAAFASGRHAYLHEIQSQLGRARQMYTSLSGGSHIA